MKKYLIIFSLVLANLFIVGNSLAYLAVGYMKCEKVNELVQNNNPDVKTMIMFWLAVITLEEIMKLLAILQSLILSWFI